MRTITVVRAPPFATIQDGGRFGFQSLGVPRSGFADVLTAHAANAGARNPLDSALIEIAVGGGTFRFDCDTTLSLAGLKLECTINGVPFEKVTYDTRAGDELTIVRIVEGRFAYLSVRGGIEVPEVLGSRSTLLSASIGGYHGRRLARGDVVAIGAAGEEQFRTRMLPTRLPALPVVRGPQWDAFDGDARQRFLATDFQVSTLSDRAGYRLDGGTFACSAGSKMLSEPTCIGAIQIPDGGSPIVLMPDGPTIGGYPKIAVIHDDSLSAFAQLVPGDKVRFLIVN